MKKCLQTAGKADADEMQSKDEVRMLATASMNITGLLMAPCRHGDFVFYQSDMIGRMLLSYGEWAEQEVSFLTTILRPGDTVIDIGAHIGTLTVPLAKAVGPSGRVFSFEAQRLIYYNLCTNITLNGLANVHAINAIVSSSNGNMRLKEKTLAEHTNSGDFIVPEGITQAPGLLTTSKIKLDSVLCSLDVCRLIKLDIEGHEPAALKGMSSLIERTQPAIFAEVNNESSFLQIVEKLEPQGYRFFWHSAPHFNPNNFRSTSLNYYGDQTDFGVFCLPSGWKGLEPQLTKARTYSQVQSLNHS